MRLLAALAPVLALGLVVSGCERGGDTLADPTPLPKRLLTDEGKPLQPVRLPEPRQMAPQTDAAVIPPAGGDPVARAAAMGKAPLESAVQRRPDGRLQVGAIIVDRDKGELFLPGQINQTDGIIEYLAVGPQGKRHESVLVFDVHPLHLQVASILVGLRAAPLPDQRDPALRIVRQGQEDPDPAAPADQAESEVDIEVSWLENGKVVTRRAEDLAFNRETKKSMARSPWIYTGGQVFKGVLTAEFEQSYIATWPDRSALFNTPLVTRNPYRGEAFGFEANFGVLPPKGTPVRVTMRRVNAPRPGPATPAR